MLWFDSKGEEAFRVALDAEKSYLSDPGYDAQTLKVLSDKIELGNKFLQSIRELKKLTHTSTHYFYEQFLFAAADILRHRSTENYLKLYGYYSEFEQNIRKSDTSHMATGGKNLFWHSLRFTLSLGGLTAAGAVLHIAVWGTASLAFGPWGVAALGIAIGVVGLLFAIYEAYNLYQNARLFKNSQFNEITEFVLDFEHLLNDSGEVNTKVAENANSSLDTYYTPQDQGAAQPGM